MTGPVGPKPWYARNLLPSWLPGWLAAALLIAAGFGICFGLFLDAPNPWGVAAVAGVIGFGFAVVILSVASARSPNTPEGQRLAPPAVIRRPLLTVLLMLGPFFWMTDGRIRPPANGGGDPVSAAVTELVAMMWLLLILAAVAWQARAVYRRDRRLPASEVLSLLVAAGVFAYGIVVVVLRHLAQ